MSVNIFGGGLKTNNAGKDLENRINTKLDKSGGTVTGDLKISLADDRLRTFGVSDIEAGKSVELRLGDVSN